MIGTGSMPVAEWLLRMAAQIDWLVRGYEPHETGHPHKGTTWPAEDYLPSIQVSIQVSKSILTEFV
jgi:hypothetical protein